MGRIGLMGPMGPMKPMSPMNPVGPMGGDLRVLVVVQVSPGMGSPE